MVLYFIFIFILQEMGITKALLGSEDTLELKSVKIVSSYRDFGS